jgi:hypothetical protein
MTFRTKNMGKVGSFGVYYITQNAGLMNLGTDADTSSFAVNSSKSPGHPQKKSRLMGTGIVMSLAERESTNSVSYPVSLSITTA